MKLLLDENLPHALRAFLIPMHQPFTVSYLGWDGIENGDLLTLAASNGFEALITTDRGLEYQQNQTALPCAVVVLIAKSNKLDDLKPLIPRLVSALSTLPPCTLLKIS